MLPDQGASSVYLSLFAARTDAYSVWRGNPTTGSWSAVREELTNELIYSGLTRKGPPISGYMAGPDSTSHVMAVDFDTDDGADQASLLAATMTAQGAPAYIEGSRRGAHLWATVDDPLPARVLRRALRGWMADAGLPDSPKIELRPGADIIHPDNDGRPGLGHCLRLPMMPHPVTGQRFPLAGPNGEKLGDSVIAILSHIETVNPKVVEERSSKFVTTLHPDDIPARYRRPREALPDDESASDILRDLWGVLNARPGHTVRCPAHDDRRQSLSILRDDRRALCKSPSCVLNNNDRGCGTFQLRKLAQGMTVHVAAT